MSFIWFILIGVLAGYIAGKLTHGKGFGFFMNLVIGAIGSVIGGFIFKLIGFEMHSKLAVLATSVCGAIVLLFLASLVNNKK